MKPRLQVEQVDTAFGRPDQSKRSASRNCYALATVSIFKVALPLGQLLVSTYCDISLISRLERPSTSSLPSPKPGARKPIIFVPRDDTLPAC